MPLARLAYPPSPALNTIPTEEYRRIGAAVFRGTVLNIGSGGITGLGRRLWQQLQPSVRLIHVDLAPFEMVSVIADGGQLPFAAQSVDSVILQAVLEHVPNPTRLIDEAHRVLKPHGHLYIEVPFLQGFHADPNDFQRVTLHGVRQWLNGFELVTSGVSSGPVSSICWMTREALSLLLPDGLPRLGARFVISWVLAPIRYLDWIAVRHKDAHRLACEFYALGKKR